jgi:catechol 2,3-dioxygenase-like lactoylglutathione lyase family enzyme
MSEVYGCNHVAIEVDDVEKAVAFYQDVFNLQKLDEGEGDAFFKLGEHQFLAMFEVKEMKPDQMRHFGIMVRDEAQLAEVRDKITKKYGLKLIPGFRCDFRDPFGNRIQVVDLHDESPGLAAAVSRSSESGNQILGLTLRASAQIIASGRHYHASLHSSCAELDLEPPRSIRFETFATPAA